MIHLLIHSIGEQIVAEEDSGKDISNRQWHCEAQDSNEIEEENREREKSAPE
jgi:hypothetical protein